MNSVKTAFVSLILLGVLYGMYQVLSTPSPKFDENGEYIAQSLDISEGEELTPIDPSEAQLPFDPEQVAEGSASSIKPQVSYESPADSAASDVSNPRDLMPPPLASSSSPPASTAPESRSGTTQPNTQGSAPPSAVPNPNTFQGSRFQAPGSSFNPNSSTAGGSSATPSNLTTNPPTGTAGTGTTSPSTPAPGPTTPPATTSNPSGSWPTARTSREYDDPTFRTRLVAAWTLTDSLIEQGKFKEALQELTFFYGDPRMTSEEEQTLLAWLDGLAAKVVYSTEHLWQESYVVKQGETLENVATRFGITEEILSNINSSKLREVASGVPAGVELKVITGPFRLRVEPAKERLTLFVGDCYAGRFEIRGATGLSPSNDLQVVARYREGKDFESASGTIPAMSPTNPLGRYIIELSDGTLIHEMGDSGTPVSKEIGVSGPDAWDLFSILGEGNRVSVQ